MSARERDVVLSSLLKAARAHLGFEVAFISQLVDGSRVFRYVDSEADHLLLEVGGSDPAEESYCQHVVQGRLPELLPDPSLNEVALGIAATRALGIGTHVSIPIVLSDGRVYGTFCCFSLSVHDEVGEADVEAVRMLARMTAEYVEGLSREELGQREQRDRIEALLADPLTPRMLFQPMVELMSGETIALEALSRFPGWREGPDRVFQEAWSVGLGGELEVKTVRSALDFLDRIPSSVRLSVNVSPMTMVSRDFLRLLGEIDGSRLMVEVTEHAAVEDFEALRVARRELSHLNVHFALDDVGMGYSGLHHILESTPDCIKIDQSLVRGVPTNPAKAAMIEALVGFADRVGVLVVAEGIESAEELTALASLGVAAGQGYAIARPAGLEAALLTNLDAVHI
jgi:EAL domain-containing protein (putative c-di-GMP-specific phosphodiesterase class I)